MCTPIQQRQKSSALQATHENKLAQAGSGSHHKNQMQAEFYAAYGFNDKACNTAGNQLQKQCANIGKFPTHTHTHSLPSRRATIFSPREKQCQIWANGWERSTIDVQDPSATHVGLYNSHPKRSNCDTAEFARGLCHNLSVGAPAEEPF